MRILTLFVAAFLSVSSIASADIITRFGDGTTPTLIVNTGIVNIPLFVRASNNDPGITAYVTGFTITPPSALGGAPLIGSLGTNTYGQPGFLGAGNIRAGFTSYFDRLSNTTAELSLEFLNPQTFPASFQTIANMRIDTTNLPTGTYNVTVTPLVANSSGVPQPTSGVNGQFIVAVPEPSSMALLILGGSGAFLARRRQVRRLSEKKVSSEKRVSGTVSRI